MESRGDAVRKGVNQKKAAVLVKTAALQIQ